METKLFTELRPLYETTKENPHVIAFVYEDDWLALDVFHGVTDGTGSYEVLKTLLYYYCTEKYHVTLSTKDVRLEEDDIRPEEWEEPIANRKDLPKPERVQQSDALNLITMAGLENDKQNTVYNIVIDEAEYMEFVKGNGGSPTTMTALLLSRAISRMYPDSEQVIRMMVCVNQRNALKVPMARHSLVGGCKP